MIKTMNMIALMFAAVVLITTIHDNHAISVRKNMIPPTVSTTGTTVHAFDRMKKYGCYVDTYRAKTVSDSFHTKNFLYGLKRTMRVLKNTVGNNEDTKDDMGFIEKVEKQQAHNTF